MKKSFYLGLAAAMVVSMLFLTGCGDDDNGTTPTGGEYMRAEISGDIELDFEAKLIVYLKSESIEFLSGYTGDNQNSDFLQLQIQDIPEGAHTLELKGANGVHQASFIKFNAAVPLTYTAYEGEIKIIENNSGRTKGTFNFKARNAAGDEIQVLIGDFAVNKD